MLVLSVVESHTGRHIRVWWIIVQYRLKLPMAESPKTATDTDNG
jgi:hypothetical protein